MTAKILRRLLVAGTTLAVALPGSALAHRDRHDHHRHHGHHHGLCHKLERDRAPKRLSAEQVQALTQACADRDAAVKAAKETFRAATKDDRAAHRAAVKAIRADVRAAHRARRDACRPDRSSQACQDARDAYRASLRAAWQKLRDARKAYISAVAPDAKERNAAVRAAKTAFREKVAEILGRS